MIDLFGQLTLANLTERAAANWPAREALVFEDRRWNFAQMAQETDRYAAALKAAGLGAGDHVGLWFVNRPEYIFLFFAIARIGAVSVPLNTRYRVQDIAYCLKQSDCAALIYIERSGEIDFAQILTQALGPVRQREDGGVDCANFPALRCIFTIGAPAKTSNTLGVALESMARPIGADERAALAKKAMLVQPSHVAMIVYTSGTTGEAKGVMLAHGGVRQCVMRSIIWGTTMMDRQMHYLPMFHLYAIGFVTIPSVALGACQILTETFDAEQALDLIARERATIIHGFDPHYRDMMAGQQKRPRDIASLRMGSFPSGPDNCVPVVVAANEALCPIYPSFGMTETWSGVTAGFLDSSLEQRSEASGYPLPGIEVRVVDPETGADRNPGEEGEIRIRSPWLMRGYYGKPEATRETIDADGFIHTGDAGYLRADGYLRFVGRYKDMLKVGGENVAPAEVELLLSEIADIADVSIVGYPDERLQEVAAAYVIARPGAQLTLEQLQNHCRGRIASFKIPRELFLVSELPMTASGKVQKAVLRAMAADVYAARRS